MSNIHMSQGLGPVSSLQTGSANSTPDPFVRSTPMAKALFQGIFHVVWVLTALIWPVLRWILAVDVFLQLLRMMYHWHTPGVSAGWTFLLHFAILTVFTCFVAFYRPQRL